MNRLSSTISRHHDLFVGLGFALLNAVAHLLWHSFDRYAEFVVSALALSAVLAVWLWREWHFLKRFVTKFYCLVAMLDLLAEGLLQPVHHCTRENLMCTGRLFLVFLAFWLVLRPLEQRWFRRALILLALMLPILSTAAATTGKLVCASGERQVTLLELFTSEGCSSCPPAETWLSELTKHRDLWRGFVPVAFHVDYWDYLGWKDRYAAPAFTRRQYTYSEAWRNQRVYTPGFVVNGREWLWSRREIIPPATSTSAGVLEVWQDGEELVVRYKPSGAATRPWVAHVALLGNGIETAVGRGENAGKKLRHDFVVLDHQHKAMKPDDNATSVAEFPAPKPATDTKVRHALAIWVEADGRLAPLQATGTWWP